MNNKELILKSVLESGCHPTADDIYQELRASGKRITLATVYNNLRTLCEERKLRSLSLDSKSERFDKPVRHDHLVCHLCGEIRDVYLPGITEQLQAACGVAFESYELKLIYTCENCQKKSSC